MIPGAKTRKGDGTDFFKQSRLECSKKKLMTKGISAIVLAGGKSARMGRDKAVLPFGGERLIDRVISALQDLFSDILVVCSRPDLALPPSIRLVADEQPGLGPLMGILSGLKASATDMNFVMACDIPDFNRVFLLRMLEDCADVDIRVPRHADGRYEPLFALYSRRVIPLAQACLDRGISKVDRIFPDCRVEFVDIPADLRLININTPADYSAYIRSIPDFGRRP